MIFLLGLYSAAVFAVPPVPATAVVFHEGVVSVNVTPGFFVLPEDGASDSIEAVSASETESLFEPVNGEDVNVGYTDKVRWFRITLTGPEEPLVLDLGNSQLLSVTLFSPSADGGYTSLAMGVSKPFWQRPLVSLTPAFPIQLSPDKPSTYYLRVRHYGALRFVAMVAPEPVARESAMYRIGLILLLAGALLGFAVFNGCIFLGLRQPAYLWLSLMLLASTLNQMTFAGTANMLLWQDPTKWGTHALTLTAITCQALGVGFCMSFLRSWKYTRGLAWVSVAFVCTGTVIGLLSLLGNPRIFLGVVAYTLLGPFFITALTLQAARKSPVALGLFFLSWGLVLLGEIMFCMMYLDVLPVNVVTENFMHVAIVVASLAWALSLTRQIKVRAKQQRKELEQEVAERTEALESALSDVKTLQGLLPVCSSCKKIRDDEGAWHHMEAYVTSRTGADFTHGICPDCASALYPKYYPATGKE